MKRTEPQSKRIYILRQGTLVGLSLLLVALSSGCLNKDRLKATYLIDNDPVVREEAVAESSLANLALAEQLAAALKAAGGADIAISGTDAEVACADVESNEIDFAVINAQPDMVSDPTCATVLAPDGVRLIVNPESPYEDFSEDDLFALVNAEEDYFEEPLYLTARASESHPWQLFEESFAIQPEVEGILQQVQRDPNHVASDDAAVLAQVLADPNAIGLVNMTAEIADARVLSFEGMPPEDVAYPGNKPLLLYAMSGNAVAQAAHDWLTSPEGQDALKTIL